MCSLAGNGGFARLCRADMFHRCGDTIPGPRRCKVRSTSFLPSGENCVRFLASPLPNAPAPLGRIGNPVWPPIVPLSRNGLASSATGGASPISPIFFGLRLQKTGRARSKRKALCAQLCPSGTKLDGPEWLVRCATRSGAFAECAGQSTGVGLLFRIWRYRCEIGVVDERLSATSSAAAAWVVDGASAHGGPGAARPTGNAANRPIERTG